jgi:hypothetical protein
MEITLKCISKVIELIDEIITIPTKSGTQIPFYMINLVKQLWKENQVGKDN